MKTEQVAVAPDALKMTIVGRVQEYILSKQHGTLQKALGHEGVSAYLGQRLTDRLTDGQFDELGSRLLTDEILMALGPGAKESPWTAYMRIMDGIVSANAKKQPGKSKLTTLTLDFKGVQEQEDFRDLCELLFAGIHGPTMPSMRAKGERLVIKNFGHADLCTLGRVGSALFRQEYAGIGKNMRLVLQRNMKQIRESGVIRFLPARLQMFLAKHWNVMGDAADGSLPTSGKLGLAGVKVRAELKNTGSLDMQRERSNVPFIERGLRFRMRKSSKEVGLPLSGTTMHHTIGDQLQERVDEVIDPFKKRNFTKSFEILVNLALGLGALEGAGSFARAAITMSKAGGVALGGAYVDYRLRRRQTAKLVGRSGKC